jgi:hypothetical protein
MLWWMKEEEKKKKIAIENSVVYRMSLGIIDVIETAKSRNSGTDETTTA